MTLQRKWRECLTRFLIRYWLDDGHYRRLKTVAGEHKNPEYRIAQDARMATDAPVDFAAAMLSSVLTAATFMQVLWSVGGDITFVAFGVGVWVPAYLVVAVLIYCTAVTLLMILVAGRLTQVVQKKNQSEAEMIAAANVLRETGEGVTLAGEESRERRRLWVALQFTLARWARHLQPAHAHDGGVAGQHRARADRRPGAVRAEIPQRLDDAGRADAGGGGVHSGAGIVQLVRGQLSARGRLALGGSTAWPPCWSPSTN